VTTLSKPWASDWETTTELNMQNRSNNCGTLEQQLCEDDSCMRIEKHLCEIESINHVREDEQLARLEKPSCEMGQQLCEIGGTACQI